MFDIIFTVVMLVVILAGYMYFKKKGTIDATVTKVETEVKDDVNKL